MTTAKNTKTKKRKKRKSLEPEQKRPVGRPRTRPLVVIKRPVGRPKKIIDPNAVKPPRKKSGRPRILFPYSEAKKIAQSESITSITDYFRWWKYNLPYKMPKRPDRAYKNDGFTWNDFLGNDAKFPQPYIKYKSLEDAKRFASTLGLKGRTEWFMYVKTGKKPVDIPARPDLYYRRHKLNWLSWKDFLGVGVLAKYENLIAGKRVIFYIIKLPNRPENVFQFGTIMDAQQLYDAQAQRQIMIVRMYYLNSINDDWKSLVERYCSPYMNATAANEYSTPNIYNFIDVVAEQYDQVF